MVARRDELYPLRFEPVLKDYPWGGRAIGTLLGRPIPPGPVAESWEISAHADGSTPVLDGTLRGRDLSWLLDVYGVDLVGADNEEAIARCRFPLLVKLLDAHQWLSVQVHPDDAWALEHEGDLGKSEMWIVLAAEPGAEILLGFKRGVDPESFETALHAGTAADCLHRTAARAGDVFFVPPGTIHAIGPGIVLAEIQQSSNVTYRVFDWNRQPPRELHVESALEVLDFDAIEPGPTVPQPIAGESREVLASCRRFHTERVRLEAGQEFVGAPEGRSFEIWGTIDGAATVGGEGQETALDAVSWILLPASLPGFRIHASEPATLVRVTTTPPA